MNSDKELINVYGARVHNLKNIDVEIPRNTLTVVTGLRPLIHYLRKGNAVILKLSLLMHAGFLAKWNAPMWIKLQD